MQILLSFVLIYGGIGTYFLLLHFGIYRRYPVETYLMMALGVWLAFAAARRRPGWVRYGVAGLHSAVWLLILTWTLLLSRLPIHPLPVSVGQAMPAFSLSDQDGRQVSSADLRGRTPALYVFYRGYW